VSMSVMFSYHSNIIWQSINYEAPNYASFPSPLLFLLVCVQIFFLVLCSRSQIIISQRVMNQALLFASIKQQV
jgi:hypothetical protein